MKKFKIASAVFLMAAFLIPNITTSASVTENKVDQSTINWGQADYIKGHGKATQVVTTVSCWGKKCGSKYYGPRGTRVYSYFSYYYGHNQGAAKQQTWG